MRLALSALVLIALVGLAGCSAVESAQRAVMSAEDPTITLYNLDRNLSPFTGNPRYDQIDGEFEYTRVGDTRFDNLFYNSARLAADVTQIREAVAAHRERGGTFDTNDDVEFFIVMTAHALQALPGMVDEAEDLSRTAASLDPTDLSPLEIPRATRGLDRARQNIQLVLDTADEVDDILEDYRALQDDLDEMEEDMDDMEDDGGARPLKRRPGPLRGRPPRCRFGPHPSAPPCSPPSCPACRGACSPLRWRPSSSASFSPSA